MRDTGFFKNEKFEAYNCLKYFNKKEKAKTNCIWPNMNIRGV